MRVKSSHDTCWFSNQHTAGLGVLTFKNERYQVLRGVYIFRADFLTLQHRDKRERETTDFQICNRKLNPPLFLLLKS
jgi:hypothetical protein